jgi:hypothetical protein
LVYPFLMRTVSILIFVLIIPSCKKHNDTPYQPVQVCSNLSSNIDSVNKYIHGKWYWVETKYFTPAIPHTLYTLPSTEGYINTINISDSTLKFYKDYFLKDKYKFKTDKGSNIPYFGSGDEAYLEFFDYKTGIQGSFVPITICSNYLVFYSMGDPISITTYKRIN